MEFHIIFSVLRQIALYKNSQNDTQQKNVNNFGISQQNLMIYDQKCLIHCPMQYLNDQQIMRALNGVFKCLYCFYMLFFPVKFIGNKVVRIFKPKRCSHVVFGDMRLYPSATVNFIYPIPISNFISVKSQVSNLKYYIIDF